MKIVAVIPARYASTRFPGKPLANICGKPMIWWVYQQVKQVKEFEEVYVAIDDEQIEKVCKEFAIQYIMTSPNHPEHISRVWEVSENITADYYICINGDEPLIESASIKKVLPEKINSNFFFGGAFRKLTDPAETIDCNNIKLVLNDFNQALYMSRSPVPYPKGTLMMNYKKYVGIECFNKKSLDFFVTHKKSYTEIIEDIDHLRFIENRQILNFTEVESESLAVDTLQDLEKVQLIIETKINQGELSNE